MSTTGHSADDIVSPGSFSMLKDRRVRSSVSRTWFGLLLTASLFNVYKTLIYFGEWFLMVLKILV